MGRFHNNTGFSVVEVVLSVAIFAMMLLGVMSLYFYSTDSVAKSGSKSRELLFASEGIEAVKSMRDRDFDNLVDGTHGLAVSSNVWNFSGSSDTVGNLTRQVVISTLDGVTKRAIVTVTNSVTNSTTTLEVDLVRVLDVSTWLDTTVTDYEAGAITDTVITNTDGGEVELEITVFEDWCNPSLSLTSTDLPGNGITTAITAEPGWLFIGTGQNASGLSYQKLSVTNDDPPVVATYGTFDGEKTNDIFGEENYGYLATDSNQMEVVILDTSSPTFTELGSYNASGSTDAETVFVLGTVGFVSTGEELHLFDLSSRIGSRPKLSEIDVYDDIVDIEVIGDYAYVAIDSSTRQAEIIDISDTANPSIVGYVEISAGNGAALDISDDATRMYLAVTETTGSDEFFIINLDTKTGSRSVIGSHDSGSMDPKGVAIVTHDYAVMAGHGGEQYQVYDILTESSPTQCGGLLVDDTNAVATVGDFGGKAYTYILTTEQTAELKIITSGPGGRDNGGYASTGEFQSRVFDAGQNSTFHALMSRSTEPANTTLTYQIRAGASSNLSGETWVGPDDTSGTYFDNTGAEITNPSIQNNRYIQYKAFFTSDSNATPILESTRIFYK